MIDNSDIIEVDITLNMLKKTKLLLQTEYVYNQMSVLKGEGNFSGKLAEVIYQSRFPDVIKKNTRDYDFILNNLKIDIKSKTCYVKPIVGTNAVSVHSYSLDKQRNDYYVFMSIKNNYKTAWIIGGCGKELFKEKSVFYKAGYIDKANNYTFFKDTNSLPIEFLDKIVLT